MVRCEHSVYQTLYNVMCKVLCGVLCEGVRAGRGAQEGIGSLRCRVSGALYALYALLLTHPVDEQGRCRSCRRPGALLVLGPQRCVVHRQASYWLRQPDWLLHSQIAGEWERGQQGRPSASAAPENPTHPTDPKNTDVLPTIGLDSGDSPTSTTSDPTPTSPRSGTAGPESRRGRE